MNTKYKNFSEINNNNLVFRPIDYKLPTRSCAALKTHANSLTLLQQNNLVKSNLSYDANKILKFNEINHSQHHISRIYDQVKILSNIESINYGSNIKDIRNRTTFLTDYRQWPKISLKDINKQNKFSIN